jgi:hypothetical protein
MVELIQVNIDGSILFGIISSIVALTYITRRPDNTFTNQIKNTV